MNAAADTLGYRVCLLVAMVYGLKRKNKSQVFVSIGFKRTIANRLDVVSLVAADSVRTAAPYAVGPTSVCVFARCYRALQAPVANATIRQIRVKIPSEARCKATCVHLAKY
jgi:hypothetical protein